MKLSVIDRDNVILVDRKGLAKQLGSRPKSFVLFELLQNAWDEDGVSEVQVTMEMIPRRPVCRITVTDNSPDGFQDLASVYTMFRTSKKVSDPTKRGRFELGDKLIAALALRMEVKTTSGTVIIDDGGRRKTKARFDYGSSVLVELKMTREEFKEVGRKVRMVISPPMITTFLNGERIGRYQTDKYGSFEATLPTVRTDEEGMFKRTRRSTRVDAFQPEDGESAWIFEMGIPVVQTDDLWHFDVQQRVPLNWARNSLPASFLRDLRVEALNALSGNLTPDQSQEAWVSKALEGQHISEAAVSDVLDRRFGPKRVIYDPSDPEGTKIAVSEGYTVIPGRALSKGAWDTVRKFKAAKPAGQVTPSPKPYSSDGRPEKVLQPKDWTPGMRSSVLFAIELYRRLFDEVLTAYIVTEPEVRWSANFGNKVLCLNASKLGSWFDLPAAHAEKIPLLIHEFAHRRVKDHLSNQFHEECCRLAGLVVALTFNHRELFCG